MNQCGAALMGVLVAVMILGLMSGIAGSTWKSIVQRAKEQELLWRGAQYRLAIESYYKNNQAGGAATLPADLESLVKDDRSVETVRHLRKLYPDPMTGEDWQLIKDPAGKITGVRSSSSLAPFKKDGFSAENEKFAGKASYSDWEFVFDKVSLVNKQTGTVGTVYDKETGTVEKKQ